MTLEEKLDAPLAPTCYPAPTGALRDICPEGMVLDSFLVLVDDEVSFMYYEYICVPDCNDVACTEPALNFDSDCPTSSWNLQYQQCGCNEVPIIISDQIEPQKVESPFVPCGCPDGYGQDTSTTPGFLPKVSSFDFNAAFPCIIVEPDNCFEGEIEYSIDPITCDSPSPNDTLRIIISGVGSNILSEGEAITIDELLNCNLITNDTELIDLVEQQFSGEVDAAFVADANGEIIIEFTRDPSLESVLLLGDQQLIIPSCSSQSIIAEDPCSCANPNITDADGNVLYWSDTLDIFGSVDSVIVLTENIGNGFLDPASSITNPIPYAINSSLGIIGANGVLQVPFYIQANTSGGVPTDISFQYSGGSVIEDFESVCGLANDICIERAIPTLGEWALIILSLLLLLVGIVFTAQPTLKNGKRVILSQ